MTLPSRFLPLDGVKIGPNIKQGTQNTSIEAGFWDGRVNDPPLQYIHGIAMAGRRGRRPPTICIEIITKSLLTIK